MMDRPARVRMRNRKPWVLARRRLFGWKVRFTSGLHGRKERQWRADDHLDVRGYTHILMGPRRTDPRYVETAPRVKPRTGRNAVAVATRRNPLLSHRT
jgi:hypothetical protein